MYTGLNQIADGSKELHLPSLFLNVLWFKSFLYIILNIAFYHSQRVTLEGKRPPASKKIPSPIRSNSTRERIAKGLLT